jgi:hypothetical protein
MVKVLLALMFVLSGKTWGLSCDCDVVVYSPLSGSHLLSPKVIKKYELDEFAGYGRKNILTCQESCLKEFQEDMPSKRLNALLVTYSMELIEERKIGFNCTGLTTLKYPVRVKAKLGRYGLGSVADMIQVVNHEEICF